MIGATAKSEQFHTRSGSESTKGSRKGFGLLDEGVNAASVLSEHDALCNQRKAIAAQIDKLNREMGRLNGLVRREARFKQPSFFLALSERDKVKSELTTLHEQAQAIREKIGHTRPDSSIVERHFTDAAKEFLTPAQFRLIMNEAHKRAQQKATP